MARILLVDSNNQLMSLFNYGETDFTYRFLSDLKRTCAESRINRIVLGFDYGKSQYRLKLHPGYKGDRYKRNAEETEEKKQARAEFYSEMGRFKTLALAWGMEVYQAYGVEFDDVASMIVRHTDLTRHQLCVLSSDGDLHGLLRPGVVQGSMYKKLKPTDTHLQQKLWMNTKAFQDIYEITPPQWYHVKALAGDKGDSVYSPNGLGDKTALAMIQRYGSIEGVEQNLGKLKGEIPRIQQKVIDELSQNFEQIHHNFKLVNLDYGPEVEAEIFSDKVRGELDELIERFDEPPRIDREAIEEYAFETGKLNIVNKFDDWTRPFLGLT